MFNLLLKVTRVMIWAGVMAALCWLAFSYLLPDKLVDPGAIYIRLMAVAFMGRVLTFQIGLALLGLAVAALILRRRRLMTLSGLSAGLFHASRCFSQVAWEDQRTDISGDVHEPSLFKQGS